MADKEKQFECLVCCRHCMYLKHTGCFLFKFAYPKANFYPLVVGDCFTFILKPSPQEDILLYNEPNISFKIMLLRFYVKLLITFSPPNISAFLPKRMSWMADILKFTVTKYCFHITWQTFIDDCVNLLNVKCTHITWIHTLF